MAGVALLHSQLPRLLALKGKHGVTADTLALVAARLRYRPGDARWRSGAMASPDSPRTNPTEKWSMSKKSPAALVAMISLTRSIRRFCGATKT